MERQQIWKWEEVLEHKEGGQTEIYHYQWGEDDLHRRHYQWIKRQQLEMDEREQNVLSCHGEQERCCKT